MRELLGRRVSWRTSCRASYAIYECLYGAPEPSQLSCGRLTTSHLLIKLKPKRSRERRVFSSKILHGAVGDHCRSGGASRRTQKKGGSGRPCLVHVRGGVEEAVGGQKAGYDPGVLHCG